MKEKPIIFNTAMVKTIMLGNKTQTRRVIKIKSEIETDRHDKNYLYVQDEYGDSRHLLEYCPYKIGQTLWVRETFSYFNNEIIYKAGPHNLNGKIGWCGLKWKPSIFMPRKIARLFLKITNIRIERVQDISAEDCINEGISLKSKKYIYADLKARALFHELWDSINKKRSYGWDKNPYVWVYDFEVIYNGKSYIY